MNDCATSDPGNKRSQGGALWLCIELCPRNRIRVCKACIDGLGGAACMCLAHHEPESTIIITIFDMFDKFLMLWYVLGAT